MNAAKSALLLSLPALLAGCGGGSGGGGGGSAPAPSPITYTWQIVSLDSVDRSNVGAGCSILAEDSSVAGNVIAAYEATDAFNILFHNSDGTIASTQRPDTSGRFTIDIADVPDNGYVSVEEYTSPISTDASIYMFTVQKDFITDMTINVRQHSNLYSCYEGEKFEQVIAAPEAVVNIDQVTPNIKYFQTSYSNNATNGQENGYQTPVESPLPAANSVLVTLFDNYDAGSLQATTLSHYKLVDSHIVYNSSTGSAPENVTPIKDDIAQLPLSSTDLTLTGHIEVSANNQLYTWQEIYAGNQNYSVVDGNSPFNGWSFKLSGIVTAPASGGTWSTDIHAPVEATTGTTLSPPTLNDMAGNTDVDSTGCSGSYCLSTTSFDQNEVQAQRSHIRSSTTDNNSFYQTIFSTPNTNQILMESNYGTLNPSSTDRIELSIAKLDTNNNDSISEFMLNSIDLQELISNTPANNFDINGLISQPSETRLRKVNLLGEELHMFKNGIN